MASDPARPAVVLLSGGLDSATTLAIARADGHACHALTLDYGQRHRRELDAAARVAKALGAVRHLVTQIDLRQFGGSALTSDLAVPKDRAPAEMTDIPVTYVPARNTVFLSIALAWAETLGAQDIFIGVNALDYSVGGDTVVWVRTPRWARLMPIREFYELHDDDYETVALNRDSLQLEWRRVTGRVRHPARAKRCFVVRLERGHSITITEDHCLFTIDPITARLVTVKGAHIEPGMPIVAPFDLSRIVDAWAKDLKFIDLSGLPKSCAESNAQPSITIEDDVGSNRVGLTRLPVRFPITDEFLYIVGLWLAEGGKGLDSRTGALAFSVGGMKKSPLNAYDYSICSSMFAALFSFIGLFGTAKRGEKKFPGFFWNLSQRQRRVVIAGLWDGDGSHMFKGECLLARKSHALITDIYHCFQLDGIFPVIKDCPHSQKAIVISRAADFATFTRLYPLRHPSKRGAYEARAQIKGRDQATGLWKCSGVWDAVAGASLRPGDKTRIYNAGGKYETSVRAQRRAFSAVPTLHHLVSSRLAFLRVISIQETQETWMYDLSVEASENFIANGIVAHNSGYPDCRPEYIEAFERMANLATKSGVEGRARFTIHTPLIQLSKADIVRRAIQLGVDLALTWSCYEPRADGRPCGMCDACVLRRKGFREAGVTDPLD